MPNSSVKKARCVWLVVILLCIHLLNLPGCVPEPPVLLEPTPPSYKEYGYQVVAWYPHDPEAFTQGLDFENGFLYEGTGLRGRSSLRKVDLNTGEILQIYNLDNQYFGEGIVIYEDRIIQLTWTSRVGFVYDKNTFELIESFTYPTEGWGITHDGERLIMSDGTATLYFLNPDTFERIGQLDVYDDDGPVVWLNELEYINGKVYANLWKTDEVVIINPDDGEVVGKIFLDGLLTPLERIGVDVLNGIAYDQELDRIFVTGKLWPKLFEIKLVPLD